MIVWGWWVAYPFSICADTQISWLCVFTYCVHIYTTYNRSGCICDLLMAFYSSVLYCVCVCARVKRILIYYKHPLTQSVCFGWCVGILLENRRGNSWLSAWHCLGCCSRWGMHFKSGGGGGQPHGPRVGGKLFFWGGESLFILLNQVLLFGPWCELVFLPTAWYPLPKSVLALGMLWSFALLLWSEPHWTCWCSGLGLTSAYGKTL